jgi:hypothetical protein
LNLSKIGIGVMVGALLAFGSGVEPGKGVENTQKREGVQKSGACFLLKVYNQCKQKGEQEGFAGDKLKCLKFAYGLEEYLQQKLPIQNKEDREKVARGLGKICYVGCMKDPEVLQELERKCGTQQRGQKQGQ